MASNKSGILEIHTVQKYIETCAKNAGLRVRFDPHCKIPCTSKNTMIIPKLTGDISETDIAKLRWWVVHECLHHSKGSEAFHLGEEIGFDARHSPFATIWNIFEDNRIERAGAKDYRGDARTIDEGWRIQTEEAVDKIGDVLRNADDSYKKVGAVWYTNLKARKEWSPPAGEFEALMDRSMTPELKDMIDKLDKADIAGRLNKLSDDKDGSEQSLQLAKEVYEILFEESADEHIKKLKEQMEANKAQQGEGKEKGKGKDGEGDGNGEGEEANEANGPRVSYEMFETHNHSVDPKTGGTGISLDYTEFFSKPHKESYDPCNNIRWINYRTGKGSDSDVLNYDGSWRATTTRDQLDEVHASEGEPGKGFGNKIRRLLQIRSQSKYIGGQKKGKLHFKNVYRACTNMDKYSEKIFRTKQVNDTLDTAVTVLCDMSGSMSGYKIAHAIDSAVLLNGSISTSLRIPLELLSFSEYGSDTFIGILKEFEQHISKEKLIDNFCASTSFMSGNADGDAVLFAYNRLRVRPEKRRILIVLSDGSPACARVGNIVAFTKKVTSTIEANKDVELYGVGIMDSNVKYFYKNHVVINKADELEKTLLELIRRSIFSNHS